MKKVIVLMMSIVMTVMLTVNNTKKSDNELPTKNIVGTVTTINVNENKSKNTNLISNQSQNNDEESKCDDITVEDVEDIDENYVELGKSSYDDSELMEYGGANVELEITINDIALPLYPTFNNSKLAIKVVKEKCSKVLMLI